MPRLVVPIWAHGMGEGMSCAFAAALHCTHAQLQTLQARLQRPASATLARARRLACAGQQLRARRHRQVAEKVAWPRPGCMHACSAPHPPPPPPPPPHLLAGAGQLGLARAINLLVKVKQQVGSVRDEQPALHLDAALLQGRQ